MLESIRKRSKSIYVFLVLGAIIVVFIFWGVGPSDNDSADQGVVAMVDKLPITGREYSDLYRRQEDYYRQVLKGPQAAEMIKRLDLKHKTLDILINRALAIKAAKKDGAKVEPEEVQDVITAIPAFSKDGAFNRDTYFQLLAANRLKPAEFEKAIEQDILAGKAQNRISKDVSVSEDDILKEFRKERRKINLDFIAIDPSRYGASIKVDDAEVKAFFEKNSSGYIVPAKVSAAYAYADFASFSPKMKVTADEIKSYYERNAREFSEDKEGAGPKPLKDVEGAIRKTLAAQKARMQGLEAARSLDAEFRKTGDTLALGKAAAAKGFSFAMTGPFSEMDMHVEIVRDENLRAAVFSLKPGETSYPVEATGRIYIVRLLERVDAHVSDFKDVSSTVRQALIAEKAREAAIKAAEDALKRARAGEMLQDIASGMGLKTGATGFFSKAQGLIPKIGVYAGNKDSLFELKKESPAYSEVLEHDRKYYIVSLSDAVEANDAELGPLKEELKARLTAAGQDKAVKDWLEGLRTKAKIKIYEERL